MPAPKDVANPSPRYPRRALETLSQFSATGLSPRVITSQAPTRSSLLRSLADDPSELHVVPNPIVDTFGLLPDHYLTLQNSTPLRKRADTLSLDDPKGAMTLAVSHLDSAKPVSISSANPVVPGGSPLTSLKHLENNSQPIPAPLEFNSLDIQTGEVVSSTKSFFNARHLTPIAAKSTANQSEPSSTSKKTSTPHVHQPPVVPIKQPASMPQKKPITPHGQKASVAIVKKPASTPQKKPIPAQSQKPSPAAPHPTVKTAPIHQSGSPSSHPTATTHIHYAEPPLSTKVIPVTMIPHKISSPQGQASAPTHSHSNLPPPIVHTLNTNAKSSPANVPSPPTHGHPPLAGGVSSGAATNTSPTPSSNVHPTILNPLSSSSAQIATHNNITSPGATSSQSDFNTLNPSVVPPNSLTNVHPLAPNNVASKRLGQALVGVFGSLVILTAALVAGIYFSRRRSSKKITDGTRSHSDRGSSGSIGGEKTLSLPALSSTPTQQLDFGVAPVLSPSNPVTRYSQGGVTLLRRLECVTASFQSSSTSSFHSDDDSPMAQTPATEVYESRSPAPLGHSNHAKNSVVISSPLSGLIETVLASTDVVKPTSPEIPSSSQYDSMFSFWEDARRSLLRSNSDDGSLNSPYHDGPLNNPFQDESTSDSHDYRPSPVSSEYEPTNSSLHGHNQHNTFRQGNLTPPNEHDFHVHTGDPHFIIEASN